MSDRVTRSRVGPRAAAGGSQSSASAGPSNAVAAPAAVREAHADASLALAEQLKRSLQTLIDDYVRQRDAERQGERVLAAMEGTLANLIERRQQQETSARAHSTELGR